MMKKSKNKIARLVLMSLAFASFFSCSKEEINKEIQTYVIEGHLYKDCNYEPVSGVFLQLIQNAPNGTNLGGLLDTFISDSNGYYKFEFALKEGFELYIRHSKFEGSNIIHDYIPKDTSIYDMDIFFNPSIHIEVSLSVLNAYSQNDTLVIQDFATEEGYRVAGPFESGFSFRAEGVNLFHMSLKENNFRLNWFLLPNRGVSYGEYFSIFQYCDNTVYVTIDVE